MSELRKMTEEQIAAAEQLVASRLAVRGVKSLGEIKVVATRYSAGYLAIEYLHDGKRAFHVVCGIPEKDVA